MLYAALRPALFRLAAADPERAHEWAMALLARVSHRPRALAALARLLRVDDPRLRRRVFGLDFPNPIGLAAGFDKNARALPGLVALGFGFIEAGTVTWHAQSGNPRPRIARLPEHHALINRMGFNNEGAARIARRLGRTPRLSVPLGISLGKSRVTSLEDATADYRASLQQLAPHADYIAVNVSSPNTPGLRSLQDRAQIEALLRALLGDLETRADQQQRARLPLLVKVAPDLTDAALDELLGVCLTLGIDGIIAVNTTLARAGVTSHPRATDTGGLSGRPLHARALAVVDQIHRTTRGQLPVIGVGGIFTAADAYAMMRAGASLVQVYTGLIYEGPAIARAINQGLLRLMENDGPHAALRIRR